MITLKKYEVNNIEDLYNMLDHFTDGVDWDKFYKERNKTAPFLKNNKVPDKVVVDFINTHKINKAIEFGCGEGRNSIFLRKNNIDVYAIDLSEIAIENAKEFAHESNVNIEFEVCDVFKKKFENETYDLAIDSGLFHHLAPHRRLQYREILKSVIKKDGFLVLQCFAEGENVADEIDDLEFYNSRRVGVAFSKERILNFFKNDFEILEVKKGIEVCNDEIIEQPYLYRCIMKKI